MNYLCRMKFATNKFVQELQKKILILDGAMGTMVQQYNLEEEDFRGNRFVNHSHSLKGNNDVLVLTKPEVIKEIHSAYFEAGSDIVETNTFSSTSIAQEDYNLSDLAYELNKTAAKIAKEVADKFTLKTPLKPRFVAGALGPTNKTASISPDVNDPGYRGVTFDELRIAYKQQTEGLLDGGVDILLVETVFDTLNAKAALFAIQEVFHERQREWPIMVSGTITDASGRTLSGQTAEAFLVSMSHAPLVSIGFNCAMGAKDLRPYLQDLSDKAPFFISAYPNAGLPNEMGEYDQLPQEMGEEIKVFLEDNLVNVLGGCCGTTPDHIKVMADLASNYLPRNVVLEKA